MLYRPSEEVVEAIRAIVFSVIQAFISCTSVINMYLSDNSDRKAANYRNSFGGNLLFRPVAITEYFNAAIALIDYGKTYEDAFLMLNGLQLNLSENPWKGFLWDGSKMIGRVSKSTIKDLLIHMADKNVLSSQEYKTMRQVYCRSLNISEADADMVLNEL